MKIFVMRT